jgi:hypothetical protein
MTETANQGTGDVITQFLLHSPFVLHLGMRLEAIEADRARLVMPYRAELATIGDVVDGGLQTWIGESDVDLISTRRPERGNAPSGDDHLP